MTQPRRGEVFWVQIGNARRPAAVLTRTSAIPLLRWIVVAPVTRTIRGAPTEVRLGRTDGFETDCVLRIDNLQTVDKRLLRRPMTVLSETRLEEVCERLAYAFGC